MRNLKKILALVLALMMVLSVMVTASAAFEDAADVQYTEAVDVMAAAGILSGYVAEDGTTTFNPKGTLTRAEAAKLIAFLATGGDLTGIAQGETVFDDVAAGHWASGFIGYGYANGIINGKTETTFVPNGKITVQEYAKLLLGVLEIEGEYTGAKWYVDVRNNAIAAKLMAGMTYTWTADVTREQAAQMTFNAILADGASRTLIGYMVDGNEELVFASYIEAYVMAGSDSTKVEAVYDTDNDLMTKFEISAQTAAQGGKDAEGRPALVYTVAQYNADGSPAADAVFAYAEAPVAIYTSEMDAVAIAAAVKALKTAKYTVDTEIKFYEDGVTASNYKYGAGVAALLANQTGNNVVVELYAGSDKVIDTAVITNTYISVTGAITEANAEAETPETIKINGEDIVNTDLALEEGVYVTYNKINNKINVETLAVAEYVVGTLTGYNSKGEYTIDGKVYTLDMHATSAIQAQFGKSYVYYLGANDTIILATALPGEEIPEFVMPTDYAVVKGSEVKYVITATTPDSFAGETASKSVTFSARVKVLLADGTYAIYNLPVIKAAKDIKDAEQNVLAAKGDYYTVINDEIVVLLSKATFDAAVANPLVATPVDISSYLTAPLYAYTVEEDVIALYAMTDISTTIEEDTVVIGCTNTDEIANNAVVVTDFYGNKILVNASTKVVYEYTKSVNGVPTVVTEVSTLGASNGLPVGYHGLIVAADYNLDTKGTASTADDVETVVYTAEMIYVQDAPVAGAPVISTNFAYVTGEYTYAGETIKVAGVDTKVYNYVAYAIDGSVITLKSTNAGESAGLYFYNDKNFLDGDASALVTTAGAYNVVAGNTVTVGSDYLNVTDATVVVETGANTLKANAYVLVFVESGFTGANANNIALMFVVPAPAV